MLTRRALLRSSAALVALAALGGCRHTVDVGSPVLSFHQGEANCGVGADDVQVQAASGLVRFSGRMTMPDPCHRLQAMLETRGQTFIVHITVEAPKTSDGFCIKCIGQAPYEGEIVSVRPGRYTVRIRHAEREVKVSEVAVS